MSTSTLLTQLGWLPAAPDDFKNILRDLKRSEDPSAGIVRLANSRLNATQSGALGRLIKQCNDRQQTLASLSGFSLGFVSNATTEIVASSFAAASARHGVQLHLTLSPYDQMMQQAFDPDSTINSAAPDAVLVATDYHWLEQLMQSHEDRLTGMESGLQQMADMIDQFRGNANAATILQTIPVPPVSLFGSYDQRVTGSIASCVQLYNDKLVRLSEETGSYLFDVSALAARVGTVAWFDPVQWNAYKLPFSGEFNLLYADGLARLLGAIRGKSRKCLVLDLDNTLWGGAIGDEGVDGIVLGQGSSDGEAFLNIQRLALQLKDRGIILAVCSKNNEDTARSAFRQHPEMLLKESDIAVFQANWIDKASNMEAIASMLNIGVDSLVLLDDNPAERAQVRAALPGVGVPELPADPAHYPLYLMSSGFFETTSFSEDDRLRAESYASNAARTLVKSRSRDLGDYLRSLDMTLTGQAFDEPGLERITQLINKTNQFNLTTRRATITEVADLMSRPDCHTLQFRLQDAFGSMGMIGVTVASSQDDCWKMDHWLMSCRVLGRRVEEAMLSMIVANARQSGIRRIIGHYIPTPKNNMVSDHYLKLGFSLLEETSSGDRIFALDLQDYVAPELPMIVQHDTQAECSGTESSQAA